MGLSKLRQESMHKGFINKHYIPSTFFIIYYKIVYNIDQSSLVWNNILKYNNTKLKFAHDSKRQKCIGCSIPSFRALFLFLCPVTDGHMINSWARRENRFSIQ